MTAQSNVTIQLAAVGQPAARDAISRKLNAFNDAITGQPDNTALDLYVTDPHTGEVLGGLVGRTSLGLFFVDLLYVPESLRKDGLGSRLLKDAEAEAKRRGCARAVLYTITFQAPAFYEKHGYRVFGEVPCEPAGAARVFMVKAL
ncbi:GNAT family N-acetyltransferase [Burkholderia stagnalis]|uniref:GNAT family N-acetyltransferase n=1 Tax=Burkholderia stagnalis TaxID=1503054 RepID=UPI000756556D|nr:GNAT family N-acetyltransferase [Burkholderia stagnalis]KVL86330.1 GCN5 family acetyltransferase [Burkholderia stagnalis]KVL92524.1 GCN5 family acetyltransferase [Burkholderia stagnalis]KVM11934.1 GCN5 family acetyltransferase [Burkholderia stagnalis]